MDGSAEDEGLKFGRHSRMLEAAILAAEAAGTVTDVDAGMISVARAAAFALDEGERNGKSGYMVAQLIGPYREALAELHMTPQTREAVEPANTPADPLEALLNDLGTPQRTS